VLQTIRKKNKIKSWITKDERQIKNKKKNAPSHSVGKTPSAAALAAIVLGAVGLVPLPVAVISSSPAAKCATVVF